MLTQLKKFGSVSVVSYATYFQDKFSLEETPRMVLLMKLLLGLESRLVILCICCWLRPKQCLQKFGILGSIEKA